MISPEPWNVATSFSTYEGVLEVGDHLTIAVLGDPPRHYRVTKVTPLEGSDEARYDVELDRTRIDQPEHGLELARDIQHDLSRDDVREGKGCGEEEP